MNFLKLDYLRTGNDKQQRVYRFLTEEGWMEILSEYVPILVGTIPISIDTKQSDLDIVCYAQDLEKFSRQVEKLFASETGFSIVSKVINERTSVVANFDKDGFHIELFAQSIPSERQDAYRHMLVEHRILQERGDRFRQQVIELKKQGVKTEPAFAQLLGLKGDPYQALLELE